MHQHRLSGIDAGTSEKAGRGVSRGFNHKKSGRTALSRVVERLVELIGEDHPLRPAIRVFSLIVTILVISTAPLNAKERNPVSQPARKGPAFRIIPSNFSPDKLSEKPGVALNRGTYQQSSGVGYIGVFLGDISEERARELQLNEVRGAVVGKVEDDSPAFRAGLIENDVILAFNDQMIQNRSQLYRLIINSSPGAKATLTISRKGSLRTLSIELGQRRVGIQDERKRLYGEADAMLAAAEDRRREAEVLRLSGDTAGARKLIEEEQLFRKQSEERRTYVEDQIRQGKIKENTGIQRPTYSISANRYSLGLTAVPIGEQLAQYFNTGESGVLVSEVRAGGAAEKVGIKAGDCIVAVNDEKVRSVSDLFRLVDRQGSTETVSDKSDAEVVLTIIRDRNERKIKVDLESR